MTASKSECSPVSQNINFPVHFRAEPRCKPGAEDAGLKPPPGRCSGIEQSRAENDSVEVARKQDL